MACGTFLSGGFMLQTARWQVTRCARLSFSWVSKKPPRLSRIEPRASGLLSRGSATWATGSILLLSYYRRVWNATDVHTCRCTTELQMFNSKNIYRIHLSGRLLQIKSGQPDRSLKSSRDPSRGSFSYWTINYLPLPNSDSSNLKRPWPTNYWNERRPMSYIVKSYTLPDTYWRNRTYRFPIFSRQHRLVEAIYPKNTYCNNDPMVSNDLNPNSKRYNRRFVDKIENNNR